jgi:hypothetical protein
MSVSVERVAAPVMRSRVGPPPPREDDGEVEEVPPLEVRQAPHNPAPVYSVLLHAPADAPPVSTNERGHWVVTWFAEGNKGRIVRFLGKGFPEGYGVSTGRFTWPDRGWVREEHFHTHVGIALREGTTAVVARGQTYMEAIFLAARLRKSGLQVSLSSNDPATVTTYGLMTYPDESEPDTAWRRIESTLLGRGSGRSSRGIEEATRALGLPSREEIMRAIASGRTAESLAEEYARAAVAAGHSPEDYA